MDQNGRLAYQEKPSGWKDEAYRKIYDHFHIQQRGSTVWREIRAGTATFLTMAYILLVNPQVLGKPHTGIERQDVVVATACASGIACLIVGFFGNLPFGLAPGLGLSAYFSYGLVGESGLSWESSLTSCAVAGIIMLLLAITHTSKAIMMLIPKNIKLATVVGMGLLLTFIGMQSIHLVTGAEDSLVRLGDIAGPQGLPVWLSLGGLMLLSTLTYHGINGAVLIGIIAVTLIVWTLEESWPEKIVQVPRDSIKYDAIQYSALDEMNIPGILAFLFVGIFDVSGVLFGLAKLGGLVQPDGKIEGSSWAFIASGVGTIVAAYLGCSPIIIHVESAAGIKEGGRTGLAACTTGIWFLLSLFFAPVFEMVPPEATAPVLILIGAMMINEATEIEWKEMDQAIPAYLTVVLMPFTFSIPNGIVFGMVSSIILFFTTGKFLRYITCFGISKRYIQSTEEENALLIQHRNATYGSPMDGNTTPGTAFTTREPSFSERFGTEPYERLPSLLLRKEEIDFVHDG